MFAISPYKARIRLTHSNFWYIGHAELVDFLKLLNILIYLINHFWWFLILCSFFLFSFNFFFFWPGHMQARFVKIFHIEIVLLLFFLPIVAIYDSMDLAIIFSFLFFYFFNFLRAVREVFLCQKPLIYMGGLWQRFHSTALSALFSLYLLCLSSLIYSHYIAAFFGKKNSYKTAASYGYRDWAALCWAIKSCSFWYSWGRLSIFRRLESLWWKPLWWTQ